MLRVYFILIYVIGNKSVCAHTRVASMGILTLSTWTSKGGSTLVTFQHTETPWRVAVLATLNEDQNCDNFRDPVIIPCSKPSWFCSWPRRHVVFRGDCVGKLFSSLWWCIIYISLCFKKEDRRNSGVGGNWRFLGKDMAENDYY